MRGLILIQLFLFSIQGFADFRYNERSNQYEPYPDSQPTFGKRVENLPECKGLTTTKDAFTSFYYSYSKSERSRIFKPEAKANFAKEYREKEDAVRKCLQAAYKTADGLDATHEKDIIRSIYEEVDEATYHPGFRGRGVSQPSLVTR